MRGTAATFPSHRATRVVLIGLTVVVLCALAFEGVTGVVMAVRSTLSRDDASYPECAVVERALAVAKGEALYGNPDVWPYHAAVYGPLTYWPVGMAARFVGLPAGRPEQANLVYWMGRTVSFVAGIAILIWLFLMSRWIGAAGYWRFLAPLLFLSCRFILEFWGTYRPDYPMVALILYAWTVGLARKRRWTPCVAALLIAAAVLHKQSAVTSALCLGAWFVVARRRRDAISYAVTLGALILVASAALWLGTKGAWWTNNFRALQSPICLPGAWVFLFRFMDLDLLPLAGGLGACLILVPGSEQEPQETAGAERIRAVKWAFVSAFVGAELLIIRTGSDLNYYLETYCWGCVLTVALLHALSKGARTGTDIPQSQPPIIHSALILLLCLLAVPAVNRVQIAAANLRTQMRPLANWERENYEMARVLRKTKGEILMVEGYAWWFTQCAPTMLDPYLYSVRVAAGGLSSRDLVAKIGRHEFQLIVLPWDIRGKTPDWQGTPTLPEEVVRAVAGSYRVEERMGRYFVHVPAQNP
jgi:hypothetical protein